MNQFHLVHYNCKCFEPSIEPIDYGEVATGGAWGLVSPQDFANIENRNTN